MSGDLKTVRTIRDVRGIIEMDLRNHMHDSLIRRLKVPGKEYCMGGSNSRWLAKKSLVS